MKRRLILKREALSELTAPELGSVAGGTHLACTATDGCGHTASFDQPCPTVPVNLCLTIGSGCVTGLNCIETR